MPICRLHSPMPQRNCAAGGDSGLKVQIDRAGPPQLRRPASFWRLNSVKLSATFHFSAGLPVFVPGVDNNRCLLQHCQLLRAEMPAINDRFVDVFAEIAPGTDEIAILTDILAPGVLDLPAVRPAMRRNRTPVRSMACVAELLPHSSRLPLDMAVENRPEGPHNGHCPDPRAPPSWLRTRRRHRRTRRPDHS